MSKITAATVGCFHSFFDHLYCQLPAILLYHFKCLKLNLLVSHVSWLPEEVQYASNCLYLLILGSGLVFKENILFEAPKAFRRS